VIALDHLDLLPQLSFLFSRVLLPKAVREDLYKRRATKNRLRTIFDQYAFFERCDEYDKGAVEILLVERRQAGRKDRGEAEAVVQAAKLGAAVVVDDPWGRKLAARAALDHHGTFWVLQQFVILELISPSTVRHCFMALRRRRFRLPWGEVNKFLVEIHESPLKTFE
jgi:predicted nucleic acid-binding protein